MENLSFPPSTCLSPPSLRWLVSLLFAGLSYHSSLLHLDHSFISFVQPTMLTPPGAGLLLALLSLPFSQALFSPLSLANLPFPLGLLSALLITHLPLTPFPSAVPSWLFHICHHACGHQVIPPGTATLCSSLWPRIVPTCSKTCVKPSKHVLAASLKSSA